MTIEILQEFEDNDDLFRVKVNGETIMECASEQDVRELIIADIVKYYAETPKLGG